MYHINRKIDKPDIGYMKDTVDKLMHRGIRLADSNKLKDYYVGLRDDLKKEIKTSTYRNILSPTCFGLEMSTILIINIHHQLLVLLNKRITLILQ